MILPRIAGLRRAGRVGGVMLLLCLVPIARVQDIARAQDAGPLTGRVVEAGTGAPLVGVNVFIAETTIGTTTDGAGRFEIRSLPARRTFDLVASMIGFETAVRPLRRDPLPFTLTLLPKTIQLGEVEVVSSNRAWQENLTRFVQLLFSSTENAAQCTLQNPEVLDLAVRDGILEAHARTPLDIENRALGYRLQFHDLELTGHEDRLQWGGALQFIEMDDAKQRRKWEKNRRKAYAGSPRHFLAALIAGTALDEGFTAFHVDRPGHLDQRIPVRETGIASIYFDDTRPVLTPGPTPATRRLSFDGALLVLYNEEAEPRRYVDYQQRRELRDVTRGEETAGRLHRRDYQVSWLVLEGTYLVVDTDGHEYGPGTLRRYGFWAWERMGEMLPFDYRPDTD